MTPPPMNTDEFAASFGERVRIRSAPETDALGVAGREGIVYGQSIPSMSGVGPVVGDRGDDYALNVSFEDGSEGQWYAPHLVELIGFDPGSEIVIGDRRFIRATDGDWRRVADEPPPPSLDRPAERPPADFIGRLLDRIFGR